jgi:hypothetical protein
MSAAAVVGSKLEKFKVPKTTFIFIRSNNKNYNTMDHSSSSIITSPP